MRIRLFGLITTLALLAALVLPATAQRPDAPPYALRGPYAVGTREFQIDDGQGEKLNATLWYPALNPDGAEESVLYRIAAFTLEGRALLDAPPDRDHGPYPLVAFSHGSRGVRFQSLFLTEHLASYGFVVVAVDHPGNTTLDWLMNREGFAAAIERNFAQRPLDVLRAIAFVDALVARNDALAEIIDTDTIAVMGHSFGGYTALSVGGARLNLDGLATWCAQPSPYEPGPLLDGVPLPGGDDSDQELARSYSCWMTSIAGTLADLRGLDSTPQGLWPATSDPRVDALVLMAPSSGPAFGPEGLAPVTAPTLVMVGSEDQATYPVNDAYPIFEQIGSTRKGLVVFENAGHYIFVDECPDIVLKLGLFDECADKVWSMPRVHDLTNHLTTAFLLATLTGDAQAAAALDPGVVDFRGVYYRRAP